LTVSVPAEFWRPLPSSDVKYDEPIPRTVVLRPVVVAEPWIKRFPVVVAPPKMVRPEIAVPPPMVLDAVAYIPLLNPMRVEVALDAVVPKVDGVNGKEAERAPGVT
jgi:hypothetical protein